MGKKKGLTSSSCAVVGGLVLSTIGMTALPVTAQAAEAVTVHDVTALQEAVSAVQGDTTIVLGDGFPQTLTAPIVLTTATDHAIEIDGAGKTLFPAATGRHLTISASGAGSVTVRDLVLTLPEASAATNGGLQVSQAGSADVTLDGIELSGLQTNALVVGGAGSGDLVVEDSSFAGNTAWSAAAMSFGRNAPGARTVIQRSTFDSNRGMGGSGYSGGAVRFDAGSAGEVSIEDSAFVSNAFVDGGTQPRGGAIAMHNSNVQLHLTRDYFAGNSTASSSTPGNADGGAVSSFNSTSNTTGSIFVSESTFENNQAQDDGAAIFIEGRATSQNGPFPARLVVENSTFVDNVSGDAGGSDGGGAIQASLRAEARVTDSTFVGNTKANGRGGVDIGGHLGIDGQGVQRPVMSAANNVFAQPKAIDTAYVSGEANVGYAGGASTVTAATQEQHLLDVFGTATPVAAVNGTTRVVGNTSDGRDGFPLTTVAIAPPLTEESATAYRAATAQSALTTDQRGVPVKAMRDAGSLEMEFVRFDARTNGGSWSDRTAGFPGAGSSYFTGADAASGWFEVVDPGQRVALPPEPQAPTGTTFAGWFTEPEGGERVASGPAAEGQTLYAQFADNAYTVTFDSAGGSAVASVPDVREGTAVARPADPVRDEYVFDGWLLDGVPYDFATPVTSDITVTATWTPVVVATPAEVRVDDVEYVYGQTRSFPATVAHALAGGELAFVVDGTPLGSVPVVDGGAVLQPGADLDLDVGTYGVRATYSEDGGVTVAAEGTSTLTIHQAETTTSIDAGTVGADASTRVGGTVTTQYGTTTTGSVTIHVDGMPVSEPLVLDEQGRYEATVAVPATAGEHVITALHEGDRNHRASSTETTVTVSPDPTREPEPTTEPQTPGAPDPSVPVLGGTSTPAAPARTTAPQGALAVTGSGTGALVPVAAGAVLLGGGLTAWALRRRRAEADGA